jgi:hypothetical protein
MTPTITNPVFYAAPFAFNGESLGIGVWQVSALSSRWLEFCRGFLRSRGAVFHGPLPPPLQRISLHFTSADGAALASFSLDAVPVGSSAYLRGDAPAAERQLLEMFVESLRRVDVVRRSQATVKAFAEVFSISERPLHIAVVWGASEDQDAHMIPELATHFAGVFLCG